MSATKLHPQPANPRAPRVANQYGQMANTVTFPKTMRTATDANGE